MSEYMVLEMYNFERKLNIQDYYVRTSPLGFITTFHNPLVHSNMFVFNCICHLGLGTQIQFYFLSHGLHSKLYILQIFGVKYFILIH